MTLSWTKDLAVANETYSPDYSGRYIPVYTFDEDGNRGISRFRKGEFWKCHMDESCLKDSGTAWWKEMREVFIDPVVYRAKQKFHIRIF